jgi:hypothetical protein
LCVVSLCFYSGEKDTEEKRDTCRIREQVCMVSGISHISTMRSCSCCHFLISICIPYIKEKNTSNQTTKHILIILVSFPKRARVNKLLYLFHRILHFCDTEVPHQWQKIQHKMLYASVNPCEIIVFCITIRATKMTCEWIAKNEDMQLEQLTSLLQTIDLVDDLPAEGTPTSSVVPYWISQTTDQDHLFR